VIHCHWPQRRRTPNRGQQQLASDAGYKYTGDYLFALVYISNHRERNGILDSSLRFASYPMGSHTILWRHVRQSARSLQRALAVARSTRPGHTLSRFPVFVAGSS
jgi:hypothetical protein